MSTMPNPDPNTTPPADGHVGSTAELGPDGKLHVDGYFTWHRRDGYVLDKRLPAEFVLEEKVRSEVDRLNAERHDLALLVSRLIRRMRAARAGDGIAAGDDALEQQCIGYLRRKGLTRPLREEGPNIM